jgi:hypothetical protein
MMKIIELWYMEPSKFDEDHGIANDCGRRDDPVHDKTNRKAMEQVRQAPGNDTPRVLL